MTKQANVVGISRLNIFKDEELEEFDWIDDLLIMKII